MNGNCRTEKEVECLAEGMMVVAELRDIDVAAQPRINSARKILSADGELRKSLLRPLLGRKK